MSVSNQNNDKLKSYKTGIAVGATLTTIGILMGISSLVFIEFLEEFSIILAISGMVISLPIGTPIWAVYYKKYKAEKSKNNMNDFDNNDNNNEDNDNYNYTDIILENKLKRANQLIIGGVVVTGFGIALGLIGIPLFFNSGDVGIILMVLGAVISVPIGTPIWIAGIVQRSGITNQMETSVEFTGDSVGLRLSW